jgi:hypothetical protein
MNNLCLENYSVSALETREMTNANGGWLWTFMATTDAFRGSYTGYDDYDYCPDFV